MFPRNLTSLVDKVDVSGSYPKKQTTNGANIHWICLKAINILAIPAYWYKNYTFHFNLFYSFLNAPSQKLSCGHQDWLMAPDEFVSHPQGGALEGCHLYTLYTGTAWALEESLVPKPHYHDNLLYTWTLAHLGKDDGLFINWIMNTHCLFLLLVYVKISKLITNHLMISTCNITKME